MAVLAATAAWAQGPVTRAWFPDGAEVELRTETTGGTQQTASEGGGIADETHMFRILRDSRYTPIFAYELEARRVPDQDAVTIRIRPAARRYPTVSAVRDFLAVRIGQEVRMEILANPATGERVYDVIRPAAEPNPYPGTCNVKVSAAPAGTVKLVWNGKAEWLDNDWTGGKPARLLLPGHGTYYLSWLERPKFRLAGYMQGDRLIFLMDTEYVQITFDKSVLTSPQNGPIWIYHDTDSTWREPARLEPADLEVLHAK